MVAFHADFVHRPLSILLVEDHADTAAMIASLLAQHGHAVQLVGSVEGAVRSVVEQTFDVIISDVGLPDGSGVSLMHGIRPFCRTPAIALTAYGSREDIECCRRAGFDLHLAKPADFAALSAAIEKVVAKNPDALG